jgi:hypothetical protein
VGRVVQKITCSEKGTEPSVALVATFPAMVFASVSRIMLRKYRNEHIVSEYLQQFGRHI